MTASLRIVLDTNVLISQLLHKFSVPQQVFDKALREGTVLISRDTIRELEEKLLLPKFDEYLSKAKRRAFIRRFRKAAEPVTITEKISVCRDPKDDMFLELAVNGRANVLVTGDKDLLVLKTFRGIPILTPAEFLNQ